MTLLLALACEQAPPTPVNDQAPFEPVPVGPVAPPMVIDSALTGAFWALHPDDCIRMEGEQDPFEIRVGTSIASGPWSGVEVSLREFGEETTLVLGADPEGKLWKLEQDAWRPGPDIAPLEFLPVLPTVGREFSSGPAGTAFSATSEIREIGSVDGLEDCVLIDREPDSGEDEFWWFCADVGPVRIERGDAVWSAVACGTGG